MKLTSSNQFLLSSIFVVAKLLASASVLAMGISAKAADIESRPVGDNLHAISLEGDIVEGDADKFRQLSVQYPRAVVFLNSGGGALSPAIEIGKIIRISGYSTVIPRNATCASSCALIWLAGQRRLLSPNGRVGFHASYRITEGKTEESGVANALIGNYLTLLNLPKSAIVFATLAAPDKVIWLTEENRQASGIQFEWFGSIKEADAGIVEAAPAVEPRRPPPIRVITPPRTPIQRDADLPSAPDKTHPASSQQAGDEPFWVYYGSTPNGSDYYYDLKTMVQVGHNVRVWVNIDHSNDNTVQHRSTKSLEEHDCKNRSWVLLSIHEYDPKGNIVYSETIPAGERTSNILVPESVGMSLWQELCVANSQLGITWDSIP